MRESGRHGVMTFAESVPRDNKVLEVLGKHCVARPSALIQSCGRLASFANDNSVIIGNGCHVGNHHCQ